MAERLDKRLVLNEWLFSRLGYSDTEQGMKQVARILRSEPVGVIKAKRAAHVGHVRRRKENHRLTWAAKKQKELDMLSFRSVTKALSISDIFSTLHQPNRP